MTFNEFCERLKQDGAYVGEDNHMHRADGRLLSRQCRNGYYMVRKMYDGHNYHFMEHRVIWYFHNGAFDETKEINHIDRDRTNNSISNLELVTHAQNVKHSLPYRKDTRGFNNHKAVLSEKDAQLIRFLCKHGYKQKTVAEMFNLANPNVVSRVVTGARYGNVQDAASVVSVYPLLVEKTCRADLPFEQQLINSALGISGESGEVADLIKKAYFQGHELDTNELIEELGDVLYYICWACNLLEIDFSELCFENMDKLNKRYPDGFSSERSINREE